jgi:O-methyltransferase involved in polyketide biosynthesis
MNTPASMLRVAPTSALVLSYAKEMYTDPLSRKYLQYVDLGDVEPLVAAISHLSIPLGAIIQLRKKMVRYLVRQFISRYPQQQICIVAAGLDPLGLQLAAEYPQLINGIYEMDQAWMEDKGRIYRNIAPHLNLPVTLLTDITHTIQCKRQLRDAGYDASQPAIIILEGIVPYITEEQFRDIMQCFTTRNARNTVIMDYLLPAEEIRSPATRHEFDEMADLAKKSLGVELYYYSRKKILNMLELLHAEVHNVYNMHAVEQKLYGYNNIYPQPGDGWMEMAAFHL